MNFCTFSSSLSVPVSMSSSHHRFFFLYWRMVEVRWRDDGEGGLDSVTDTSRRRKEGFSECLRIERKTAGDCQHPHTHTHCKMCFTSTSEVFCCLFILKKTAGAIGGRILGGKCPFLVCVTAVTASPKWLHESTSTQHIHTHSVHSRTSFRYFIPMTQSQPK